MGWVGRQDGVTACRTVRPSFLPQFGPNYRRFSPFLDPDPKVSRDFFAFKPSEFSDLPSNSFGIRFMLELCPPHNSNSEEL